MTTEEAARTGAVSVRIVVPNQLRELARLTGETAVAVAAPVTVEAVIDALEIAYPALAGTIRDHDTGQRRPMIRIYAAGQDYSDAWTDELPRSVRQGREPLRLLGAIAGG